MIDAIEQNLLREVADLDSLPVGAYNIRANGQLAGRNTTANIDIVTKDDKPGIDIYIRPFTKNESVHIPVILSQTGLTDLVYNDFHIGEGADVTIIAQQPKLAPYLDAMTRNLAAALGGAPTSVKATTTEGLGFTGRGEGIAAQAVASLCRA